MNLPDGKNAHDVVYAKRWCQKNNVRQKLYTLDIFDFVKNELDRYIENGYVAGELFRYMMIKEMSIVEDMGGFAVLGGGEQLYEVDASKKVLTAADPYLNVDISYTTPLEWCRRNHVRHEPFFYFSTPEIMLAWLRIPLVDFVLKIRISSAIRQTNMRSRTQSFVITSRNNSGEINTRDLSRCSIWQRW